MREEKIIFVRIRPNGASSQDGLDSVQELAAGVTNPNGFDPLHGKKNKDRQMPERRNAAIAKGNDQNDQEPNGSPFPKETDRAVLMDGHQVRIGCR